MLAHVNFDETEKNIWSRSSSELSYARNLFWKNPMTENMKHEKLHTELQQTQRLYPSKNKSMKIRTSMFVSPLPTMGHGRQKTLEGGSRPDVVRQLVHPFRVVARRLTSAPTAVGQHREHRGRPPVDEHLLVRDAQELVLHAVPFVAC